MGFIRPRGVGKEIDLSILGSHVNCNYKVGRHGNVGIVWLEDGKQLA